MLLTAPQVLLTTVVLLVLVATISSCWSERDAERDQRPCCIDNDVRLAQAAEMLGLDGHPGPRPADPDDVETWKQAVDDWLRSDDGKAACEGAWGRRYDSPTAMVASRLPG